MLNRDTILAILRQQEDVLRARHKVRAIGLFGSYVRGQQMARSDVDLLVEFSEPVSLIEFLRLEYYLTEIIGHKVDLVAKTALRPSIGERILDEVAYP